MDVVSSFLKDNLYKVNNDKLVAACGPHGCSCTLIDNDEMSLKVFLTDDQPFELPRSRRVKRT